MSKALNDAHDATTIETGRNLDPGLSFGIHRQRLAIVWGCPLTIEKFAAKGELGSAMAVGHEAEVADAVEPRRPLRSSLSISTLVRAIAGLWPWGGGSVNFHPNRRLFMLPQKPYVPLGTLRRAVAYPAAAEDWTVVPGLWRVSL